MRRVSDKARAFQRRKQIYLQRKERHAANVHRSRNLRRQNLRRRFPTEFALLDSRNDLRRSLYRQKYTEDAKTIYVEGELGIEEPSGIEYFFEKAYEIIDFNNRELNINLEKCTRVWPSAITMLCSLRQWTELSTIGTPRKPAIRSSASDSAYVNLYLKHCGFYEYVNRPTADVKEDFYSDEQVVKIRREKATSNIEIREDEIVALLTKYSTLDHSQIERFNCVVLTEVLLNVIEHGITYVDKGWWVLAQYHPTHRMISVCIADNGIGIRNVLTTGPQKGKIRIGNSPLNDADFIELALTEQISGALLAPERTKRFFELLRRYERGAHRGNGLKRIRDTCKTLRIPFAIISHNGGVFVDGGGNIVRKASRARKVFAGTLHHFTIPAKGRQP